MAIKSLVIHRITRYQEDQPAELKLRDNLLTVTADYESLLTQEKKLFNGKPGKKYGRFTDEIADAPFSNWLREALEEKMSFLSFSQKAAETFKHYLDEQPIMLDGYLMFVLDSRADGDVFYLLFIETASGMELSGSLELETVDYINTSKLEMAARIELNDWLGDSPTEDYLVLAMSRTAAKNGDIFSKMLGYQNSIDTEKETETLLETLEKYTKKIEGKEAAQCRKKAYDFCVEQQQIGEPVQIEQLSNYIDENEPQRFASFAREEQSINSETEFRPDNRKLKHLVRFTGKGNGMSLSFSSDLIQSSVHYNPANDTLTITEIPKSLKAQLSKFINQGDD